MWEDRQKQWKIKLINASVSQKSFCEDNNICPISFSNWVTGRTRSNKENENAIEELLKNYE